MALSTMCETSGCTNEARYTTIEGPRSCSLCCIDILAVKDSDISRLLRLVQQALLGSWWDEAEASELHVMLGRLLLPPTTDPRRELLRLRSLARGVMSGLKHGNPCFEDCLKCKAEAALSPHER